MITASQIPTTGRKVGFQLRQLGFGDVIEFAKTLPHGAFVIDVGAGLSRLGHEATQLRDDITWINLDPYYASAEFDRRQQNKLSNVEFCQESILNPSKRIQDLNGKVDFAYSYWMLPHLSLENNKEAVTALKNIRAMMSPKGVLAVGPVRKLGLGFFSPYRYKGTLRYAKHELTDEAIHQIVNQTKLWWLPRRIQRFSNHHNIHFAKYFVGGK